MWRRLKACFSGNTQTLFEEGPVKGGEAQFVSEGAVPTSTGEARRIQGR